MFSLKIRRCKFFDKFHVCFLEYNNENTLPSIQYRENTSKNTISRIHFQEYNIEKTLQRIHYPEYTSFWDNIIENAILRIQYREYTSKNTLSRIHFQEYNVKSAPPFVRSQNTLPRMKHTSTMKEVQEYNIKRAPPLLPTIRQILEYTSLNSAFKHTSMLSSQKTSQRFTPSITHPLCTITYANIFYSKNTA